MPIKKFRRVGNLERRPDLDESSLPTDKRFEVLKRLWTAGSNPAGGCVDHVEPCEITMYYVYALKSRKDGRFYVGCTDLRKRIAEHNDGKVRSTRHRIPFDLLYYEASENQSDTLHREKYLKTTYGKRYLRNRLKHALLI